MSGSVGRDHGDADRAASDDGRDHGDAGRESGEAGRTPAFLAEVRADPRKRTVALAVAAAVGLAAAWVHWLGLFLAGGLLGLVSETLPRAVLSGLAFGVTVLVATVLVSPAMGFGEFLALTPAVYVTVAAGLVAPVWGSLVRGVV